MSKYDKNLLSTTELRGELGIKVGLSVDFIRNTLKVEPAKDTPLGSLWTFDQKVDVAFAYAEHILKQAGVDTEARGALTAPKRNDFALRLTRDQWLLMQMAIESLVGFGEEESKERHGVTKGQHAALVMLLNSIQILLQAASNNAD